MQKHSQTIQQLILKLVDKASFTKKIPFCNTLILHI